MRICLIEDNHKLATSSKKSLESESYAVDVFENGEEGYEQASVEEYDLILLDLGLPDMDGITIATNLRAEKINTPILMLTARDSLTDKIKGFDSGGDDYIVKPFNFDELLAHIRALIRRGSGKAELIYQVDNLTLNPSSHIVVRGEKEILLSAKEYALLEYLMQKSPDILTKQQIIDHVWDSELDPFSNTVDVYIGYLRKKIDKDFPQEIPLITTKKGLGYRIGA